MPNERTYINFVLPDGDLRGDSERIDMTDAGAPLPRVGQAIRVDEGRYVVSRIDWVVLTPDPSACSGSAEHHVDVMLRRAKPARGESKQRAAKARR